MKIESNRIYINGFLQPLESVIDRRYILYPYRMVPNYIKLGSYSVNIDGLADRGIDNNKLDILAQVDLFNNKISSGNITDLFSLLYYEVKENVTTYTHYSTTKTLNFCPNKLGLLDLKESYTPLALQNISTKLCADIYQKNYRLLTILSHWKDLIMKLQHDTHYITKSLDVRYITTDNVSKSHLLSKHSLYNPNNIDSTVAVSEYGLHTDIVTDIPLSIKRETEGYIILQNFEIIDYYGNSLIKTVKEVSNYLKFSSFLVSKSGCIVAIGSTSNKYFPILALFYKKDNTLANKLGNLIRCLQWKDTQHLNLKTLYAAMIKQ